jgi:hypothetical protein
MEMEITPLRSFSHLLSDSELEQILCSAFEASAYSLVDDVASQIKGGVPKISTRDGYPGLVIKNFRRLHDIALRRF